MLKVQPNDPSFEIKSLHDVSALKKAVDLIGRGEPIGIYNRGVCAIWGDGDNPKFYEQVTHIKGEKRAQRPLATTLMTSDFLQYIDTDQIPDFLRPVFLDSQGLAARTGSLCFLRMPVVDKAIKRFPSYVVSKNENEMYEMQNWDAYGHKPTHTFIELLSEKGVSLPAVTSMNITGSPEIVDQDEGVEFAKKAGIRLFLIDEKDPGIAKGSFAIIGVNKNGLSLIRDGHFPSYVFPYLFGVTVDTSNTRPAVYPQIEFPKNYFDGHAPEKVREKIIEFIS